MTKIDLYEGSDRNLARILQNKVVSLRLGFVCTSTLEFEAEPENYKILSEKFPCLNPDNFGRMCMIRKVGQVLKFKLRGNMRVIKDRLQEMLSKLQKSNDNALLTCDVKKMNQEAKQMLLLKLIGDYTTRIKEHLQGNEFEMNAKLKGAALINDILDKKFKNRVTDLKVMDCIQLKDIYMTIMNTNGFQTSLFVSQRAFELLITFMIKKLLPLSLDCLSLVFDQLKNIFGTVWIGDENHFYNLRNEITSVVFELMAKKAGPARLMIEQFFEIETGYINTKHPDFLLSAKESIKTSIKECKGKKTGNSNRFQEDQDLGSGYYEESNQPVGEVIFLKVIDCYTCM